MTPSTIQRIRTQLGLTQAQLADALGVSRNTVTRWEMGLHPISKPASKLLLTILELRGF